MIRKSLEGAMLALVVLAAGPALAEAQMSADNFWSDYVCAEASFNPCVDFELFRDDSDSELYYFKVTYAGSLGDPEGLMTAAGLYDYDGDGSPWTFTDLNLLNPTTGWKWGGDDECEQLSGGGNVLFEGCAQGNNGILNGIESGGYLLFSFRSTSYISNSDFAYFDSDGNLAGGDLGARAMIQGVGEEDCSYKLDSPQGLVSGCGGEVVPEPMTVLLLATGLFGIGAVGYRNRRREEDEV